MVIMFIHTAHEGFDPVSSFGTVPLYQGLFFRRWQERYGRKVIALVLDDGDGAVQVSIQCFEYVLPVVGSLWVAPLGPVGSFVSDDAERAFYKELRSLCVEASPKTVALRVQKEPEFSSVRMALAERSGGSFVQPSVEEVVSLEGDLEDIVGDFSKNTRRVIRRYEQGELEGVRFHVERSDFKQYFSVAYDLLQHLARAKRFGLHSRAYYEALFEELQAHPESGVLLLGYVDGEEHPVSFMLVVYTGSEAYHLSSATSAVGYDSDMPLLAHYVALKEAKERGMSRFNLGGIVSTSPGSNGDLSLFKKKFGGERIEYSPSMDVVISGWRYALFRFFRLRFMLLLRRSVMRFYKMVEVELQAE